MVRFLTVVLGITAAGAGVVAYNKYKESRKRLPEGSHVVIVGAGYGGLTLAGKMHGKGNYTLIDAKDSMHHNLASLRAVVEPGFAVKTFIPLAPKHGEHFKQGKVVAVDTKNKTISVAGEEKAIPYSHLVFATGTSGPFPGKCDYNVSTSELIKQYEDYAQIMKKAQNVVIIGGGAVGVELAAEVAKEYPQKSVTLVHRGDTLVTNKLAKDALDRINKGLEELKVKILRRETVENMDQLPVNQLKEGLVVKTSSGRELQADLVIPCVGLQTNSEAYESSIPEKVNKRGQLTVDDFFRVKGLENVYAIGDCNDFPITKMALESNFQAEHLWNNLSSTSEPKPYKAGGFKMVIPLGRDGGILQFGTRVFGDWAAKRVKSKEVLVPTYWKLAGQKEPAKSNPEDA